jgi:glyoxylase-like metal-dependent hydrolase (beta-lactamase superfamily II)
LVGDPEAVGTDVYAMRGGLPRHGMNVFFVHEPGGVACFDSGSREMAGELQRLAAPLGGITRVVLSHSHPDHRGAARSIGAPVWCHAEERGDVEGDAGKSYWSQRAGARKRDIVRAMVMGRLRDGGPVRVDGTLVEGDPVGSFVVLHLPGHAPGQIALWREEDRTILASDCFYTTDERTAGLPTAAFNHDSQGAAASVRRIAELEPNVAWPGHGPSLHGDVRSVLERALAAYA